MRHPTLAFIVLLACSSVRAEISSEYQTRVVNAIYRVEGGEKARSPYGVLSVKVKSPADARRVCENTVRNNWTRWEKAGRPGHFLDFLADRYCPPSADPKGNRNWKKNIHLLVK